MRESHRSKVESGSSNEESHDDFLVGTSARTRPFSFDDIMVRRKNKGNADIALAQEDGKAVHFPELNRQTNEDSRTMEMINTSSDYKKVTSQRKRDIDAPRERNKLVQDKHMGSRDSHAKSKSTEDKKASSNRVAEGEGERRYHSSDRKRDGFVNDDSGRGSDKRKARSLAKEERVLPERIRVKSEIVRNQLHNEDGQVDRKRKTDERMSGDSEHDHKERNARDMQTKKRPEKEIRHKRHYEEDKSRVKNHDSDKKRLEPTRANPEESRPKRRRSRSREREKDRMSRSHSPKVHKHTSKEVSSHSIKDESGKEHSDVGKKRISSNGSNHNRRNTGALSGLGGYSPRKRKTEAAAKTPSPTRRSPEKRSAGWDFKPVEKESSIPSATLSNMHNTSQSLSLNVKELPSVTVVTTPTIVKTPVVISQHTIASQMHDIESIQLTQATRPMRRLYAENLPASASEKDLIESINKFLLSSGANYVRGTEPCISCIMHKEKGQALLEFLTPEDASVALSFDGITFAGCNLKLRRPKDYANVATALPDKSVVAVDTVSCNVEDSPHKIFIGGISKLISSKMLLEIARAFGPVKAFHYEFLVDIDKPCAFLEYVDHSVTSKACAGLNGMRLSGNVVTAVFATPEAVMENVGKPPFYGIPEQAKPLLEKPTAVLKLKNVLDSEGLLSLSESELEEVLEDIRLEGSRFGTVKSVNIAKPTKAYEEKNINASTNGGDNLEFENRTYITEQLGENINESGERDRSELPEALDVLDANGPKAEENSNSDNSGEFSNQQNSSFNEVESNDNNIAGSVSVMNTEMESNKPLIDEELKSEDNYAENVSSVETEVSSVFEAGSVFVEYRRAEAACLAAHCLHGRIFDGRVVSVKYVDHDLYLKRFRR